MTRRNTNRTYRIASIAGDGIGKEVVPEGLRVLATASKKFGFELQIDSFDFASCDYHVKHGRMMPEDWKAQIGSHDDIFFGAVGWPELVPDHISLMGVSNPIPSRIRPVCKPQAMPAHAGRAITAGRPWPRRH